MIPESACIDRQGGSSQGAHGMQPLELTLAIGDTTEGRMGIPEIPRGPMRRSGVLLALVLAVSTWPCRSSCFAITPSFPGNGRRRTGPAAIGLGGGGGRSLDAHLLGVPAPARRDSLSGRAGLSMVGEGGNAGVFAPLEKVLQQCASTQVINHLQTMQILDGALDTQICSCALGICLSARAYVCTWCATSSEAYGPLPTWFYRRHSAAQGAASCHDSTAFRRGFFFKGGTPSMWRRANPFPPPGSLERDLNPRTTSPEARAPAAGPLPRGDRPFLVRPRCRWLATLHPLYEDYDLVVAGGLHLGAAPPPRGADARARPPCFGGCVPQGSFRIGRRQAVEADGRGGETPKPKKPQTQTKFRTLDPPGP